MVIIHLIDGRLSSRLKSLYVRIFRNLNSVNKWGNALSETVTVQKVVGQPSSSVAKSARKHEKETANNRTKRPEVKLQTTITGYFTRLQLKNSVIF